MPSGRASDPLCAFVWVEESWITCGATATAYSQMGVLKKKWVRFGLVSKLYAYEVNTVLIYSPSHYMYSVHQRQVAAQLLQLHV